MGLHGLLQGYLYLLPSGVTLLYCYWSDIGTSSRLHRKGVLHVTSLTFMRHNFDTKFVRTNIYVTAVVKHRTLSIGEEIIIPVDESACLFAYVDYISAISFRYYPNRGSEATPFCIRTVCIGCDRTGLCGRTQDAQDAGFDSCPVLLHPDIELVLYSTCCKGFLCVQMCNNKIRHTMNSVN
jgi:hypothetical protein